MKTFKTISEALGIRKTEKEHLKVKHRLLGTETSTQVNKTVVLKNQ